LSEVGVRFLILGPVQVVTADGRGPSYGPRQTKVLAALLLAANDIVAVADLVDQVWDDQPPATARRQIQNCIWTLRQHLDIVADGPGYRVRVDDGGLDAAEFAAGLGHAQCAADDGRSAEAVERLRDALALWRGPALAGCTGRLLQLRADRLNEQRLAAVEQRIDLELQLGRHGGLIGEISELVGSHPLRERLVGQLMRALYAAGRRADALAAYHLLRVRLADELGIDPGTDLERLHTAILRNDVSPVPAAAARATGTPARPGGAAVPAPRVTASPTGAWSIEPASSSPLAGSGLDVGALSGAKNPLLAAIDCAAETGLDSQTWQLAWSLANYLGGATS
jgi:DNA-binding SARP family transcriptional activator